MMKKNALIIDDEEDACKNIEHILHKYFEHQIEVCASVHSTSAAEISMKANSIQLYFVDINMPFESGIQFVRRNADKIKHVIFVTAYDQYAIEAFKLHAMDYILKPIDENEFIQSVQHILDHNFEHTAQEYEQLTNDVHTKIPIETLVLRDKQQVTRVVIHEIIYIEAEKSYSKIVYMQNKEIKTFYGSHHLAYYEELLEPHPFIRVHKSYLVNKNFITRFDFSASHLIIMNQFKVPVSRRKQAGLIKML